MSLRIGSSCGSSYLISVLPPFARDEVVDHAAAQRAGPIEGVERDEVVEPLRLGLAQDVAHARALELEHAVGQALAKQLVRLAVVERDVVDVQLGARRALDLGERVLDQRQRAEAEEVHLEEADPLDLLHRPLRDDFIAPALVERRVVGDRAGRDDDAGGVRRGVPRHAFQPAGDVEQLLDLRVAVLQLPEGRRLLHGLLERHVERRGDQLGDLVGIGQGNVERARDVAHGGLGLHRPERDDLRDVLAAVAPRDVLDDLPAPPLAEVDVDVGQRHALGIQEALEDEVVLERVDVGDAKAVRDQAAGGRAAAGPTGMPCSRAYRMKSQTIRKYPGTASA